jgi:hypothetical protein
MARGTAAMTLIATLIRIEMGLFLGAVALIVFFRLIAGHIDLGSAQFHRLQLLIVTLGIAAYYLALVVNAGDSTKLPDPGGLATAGLGASGMGYVIGKLADMWPAIFGSANTRA